MIAVRIVQAAVDHVAGMVAVRHGFVTTARAMKVLGAVSIFCWFVFIWILVRHRKDMLFNSAVFPLVVQVAVVHVVHVAVVLEAQVSAIWAVRMRMGFGMRHLHGCLQGCS